MAEMRNRDTRINITNSRIHEISNRNQRHPLWRALELKIASWPPFCTASPLRTKYSQEFAAMWNGYDIAALFLGSTLFSSARARPGRGTLGRRLRSDGNSECTVSCIPLRITSALLTCVTTCD